MKPEEVMDFARKVATDLQNFAEVFRRHKHDDSQSVKMNEGMRDVLMSFETNEQTAVKIYFPFAVRIVKIRGFVVKAIADSDNGTIQGSNSTGNSTGGLITAVASDALATEYSVMPTTNNYVGKNSYYKLTSAKSTAGGKVLTTIEYERI